MEGEGRRAELVEGSGEQVLPMVLLHVIEAAGPVELGPDLAGLHRLLENVQHGAVPLLRVEHPHAAELASVARLTANLRIDGGPVQVLSGAAVEIAQLDDAGA